MSVILAEYSLLLRPRALALPLATVILLAACGSALPRRHAPPAQAFVCAGHKSFQVRLYDRMAWVTTADGAYSLGGRTSSIGRKYASDEVTLILDEERGILVGAAGGPFRDCKMP